jgi:hypothetical protein
MGAFSLQDSSGEEYVRATNGQLYVNTLVGNVTGNADTATAIKPLGNFITLAATPTSVTKIIKIASVDWSYMGSINISSAGANIDDGIKVYINGGHATYSGIRVIYGKNNTTYGIKKIIVTRATEVWNSNRNIYAEIVTVVNNHSTTTLGVVETNRGTFTPSMTEVSSVEGTVLDSLPLDYYRGDISSYQHVFTKKIIGTLVLPKFTGKIKTEKAMNKVIFYDENDDVVNPVNAISGLEIGDVVWIKYEGYDKLHTVELLEAGYMIVNYEHCNTRCKGSLMLEDKTKVSATVELLTKWYNAPTGLGQAWVDVGIIGAVAKRNTTGRGMQVKLVARGREEYFQISANGTSWLTSQANWVSGEHQDAFVVIPSDWWYKESWGGTAYGNNWELR